MRRIQIKMINQIEKKRIAAVEHESGLAPRRIMFLRAALVCLGLTLLGLPASGKTFRFDYQRELEISSGATLSMNNSVGVITIRGREGSGRLTIEAVKTVKAVDEAAARKIAEYVELKLSSKSGQAKIETILTDAGKQRRSFWDRLVGVDNDWFVSVDYIITAPRDIDILIENNQGEITVSGFTGNLEVLASSSSLVVSDISGEVLIDITSGEVSLSDLHGNVEITTTSAAISVSSLTGDLTVHGGSGDLSAEYVAGNVTIVQTSGDVTLTELQGNARLKTTSGVITVAQERGALDVFTHTGKVVVNTELFSDLEYSIETLSGEISFSIPDNAGARIKLSTLSGEIDTRGLPLEVESFSRREISGVIGGGGAPVRLKTDSGDIRLAWY